MFNYNSELLYLSVSSPALVSLHRTWKKVEQRRNSWKGVEEEEGEEEGEREGETRRWRRRWRHWWQYAGSVVALVHQAAWSKPPPLAPVSLSPTLPCLLAC